MRGRVEHAKVKPAVKPAKPSDKYGAGSSGPGKLPKKLSPPSLKRPMGPRSQRGEGYGRGR